MQGAFTYAIGPDPGPAPQFPVPKISATAATPQLLIARWVMFVAVMASIGLLALRLAIARPVVRLVDGASLRAVSIATVAASVLGLIAIPVYLDFSTANDSLRSVFDVATLVPLFRVTAFGRAMVDLELGFALFCVAAWISLWVDRPQRQYRSIAELAANCGAVLAAAAVLVIPGAAGHAGQTSPRGLTLALDWLHMVAGSVWLGGLIGLIVIWGSLPARRRVPALTVVVPRFSNVALVSVLALGASGATEGLLHTPAVNALWQTGYGVAMLVKVGTAGHRDLVRVRQPAAQHPAVGGCARAARARRAGGTTAARARQRRDRGGRRRGVRSGGALESRPTATRVRARELCDREGRARYRRSHRRPRRLRAGSCS